MRRAARASAIILASIGSPAATPAMPRATTGQRAEVPIREVVLGDGTRRYGVSIVIGTTRVEAGLDTGSTGLRVLPTGLAQEDVRPTPATDYMEYGGGVRLDGNVAEASVAVGALRGNATLQLVRAVSCVRGKADCTAAAVSFARYRIMGGDKPDEGFAAILGINMGAAADVANPLRGLGAHRWIIDLPRPGEPGPGRLVLNPTEAETAGYAPVEIVDSFAAARGSLHDAVRGCLVNGTSREKTCGAVVLDIGDPGLRIVSANTPAGPWPGGTPITLFFADAAGHVHTAEQATIGMDQTTTLVFENRPGAHQPFILTGVLPYLSYSVLYDPEHGTIAFKPRSKLAGAPFALPTD
ncbi:hypothetical protein [Sphingomonas bacterium]|uniref:hypothetical protein n=1 Tax=Sphingomonas bacterium TaxID=1895847 RepID=UPI00157608F3|nr:hypothetical protein [Sphingomonas bacterium]